MMPNHQQQQECISLLSARRSLSKSKRGWRQAIIEGITIGVNIFLKMCRDTDQLLRDLGAGNAENIGADRLRTLAQLLPSEDEVQYIKWANSS
jgi:hypothetical protein